MQEHLEALNKIITLFLTSSEASIALAVEFEKLERAEEAELFFKHATSLNPDNLSEIFVAYSDYFSKKGNLTKAIDFLNKTLEIEPDKFNANSHLGIIYLEQKDYEKAEIYLKKAIQINKEEPNGYVNYGLFLYRKGQLDEAEKVLENALKLSPKNVLAINNLGLVYEARFDHPKAVETFKQALKIQPDYLPALSNIALSLNKAGKLIEALSYAQQGLAQDPNSKPLLINTAVVYQGVGDIKQAIDANLNVISQDNQNMLAYNNLFYSLCLTEAFTTEFFTEKLTQFGKTVSSMADFQYDSWNRHETSNKMRIGFVSADFFDHPVGSFLLNVIKNINKHKFDLIAYTNNPHVDGVTVELKKHFKEYVSIVGLNDADAAKIIHDHQIDLLIDLSGHTAGNRLSMFAYKPAPVQMTWLGYWDSTGVQQIDYILLDEMSAPKEMHAQFTETVQYIPETRFCYSPPNIQISANDLPAIKNGYITFGAYHNFAKASDEVISLWASVLNALPTSKFRWQTKALNDENLIKKTHQKFKQLGIKAERIQLFGYMSRSAYLQSYQEIDFILDCFPFSACTTTCDALWMGVPTLTLPSNRLGGRQGASLMNSVGLPSWIANSKEAYIAKAVEFANDLDGLAIIREKLRQQLINSLLGDAQSYAINLENVWVDVLKRHEIIEQKNGCDEQSFSSGEQLEDAILEVFNIALHAHENGLVEEAAKGYLEILNINQKHPEANHHLGLIETHTKGVNSALPRFEAAVMAKPSSEQFWVSYIDALILSGAIDTAASAIEHGLKFALSQETANLLANDLLPLLEAKKIAPNVVFDFQKIDCDESQFIRPKIENPIKFIVLAPQYNHKSAGICVLHKLCDSLNRLGHFATMVLSLPENYQYSSNQRFYKSNDEIYFLKDIYEYQTFLNEGVVIYPEIVTGNPLNAPRVVRYMLNKEGNVAGNKTLASDKDFILAFSKEFHSNPHAVLTCINNNPIFSDENTAPVEKRTLNLTYVGKGSTHQVCSIIPNSVEINRQYPVNKAELAILLKNTRYFFSWDTVSQINIDALFSGAIPVFMSPKPFKNFEELHKSELGKFPFAICTVENETYEVTMPNDYQETASLFKTNYLAVVNEFEVNLLNMINALSKHFNLDEYR